MKNIAVFASGEGTNAQAMMDHFKNNPKARVVLIVCNNPKANVIKRAERADIPCLLIDKKTFTGTEQLLDKLYEYKTDLIVLAGFLWLIPAYLTKTFHNRIVNIHPALLPKYGGKGMYGSNVHKAVIDNKEKESGISIHFVNEHYDEGELIAQFKCSLNANDTAETLAAKIHELEQAHYTKAVEDLIEKL